MKKRLVFNFYIFPEWKENEINKIHLKCLKKEIYHFDELLFVIMLDDINNIELINEFEKTILEFNFKGDISFKIRPNSEFRESYTFYNEIICENKNEIVFFGHNKGITNILKYDKKQIYTWIIGMYFFNFYDIQDVENKLIATKGLSYGSYLSVNEDKYNSIKYHWAYIGTFFWLNNLKLKQYIENNEIKIPTLNDRFYDEEFLGNLFPHNWSFCGAFDNSFLKNANDFYSHSVEYTNMILFNDKIKEDFNNYYNLIVNNG